MIVFLCVIIGVFVFYTSIILPWLHNESIKNLNLELQWLKDLQARECRKADNDTSSSASNNYIPASQSNTSDVANPTASNFIDDEAEGALNADARWDKASSTLHSQEMYVPLSEVSEAPKTVAKTVSRNYEQQFGSQAFVWMGGIALAMAGFFLVKYSIESGLLSPVVRVIMGTIFGIGLLCTGYIVRLYPEFSNGQRISQALTGAGIADLFGCIFAATTLYHFLPPLIGFACMVVVTGLALILSLRHGIPIAILGLVGGYATPLLIHGEPHAPLLFGYLYILFMSFVALARRENWWWLSLAATGVGFLWVTMWLVQSSAFVDGEWLSLFVIGVAASVTVTPPAVPREDNTSLNLFRIVSLSGALILMTIITHESKFGTFEWVSLGMISAGAVALAVKRPDIYIFAPWLALIADSILLLAWDPHGDAGSVAAVLAGFGTLFVGAGLLQAFTAWGKLPWVGLGCASMLGFYLLAYDKFAGATKLLDVPLWISSNNFWAVTAAGGAGALVALACHPAVQRLVVRERDLVQAVYWAISTAFLSIGLAILLKQEFLSFAIAVQILLLSWLYSRLDIPALRPILFVVLALFGLLFLQQCFGLLLIPFDDFMGPLSDTFDRFRSVSELVFRLGLPPIMFAMASWVLRRKENGAVVTVLEAAAVTLVVLLGFNLIGKLCEGYVASFTARGLFNNLLLAMSLCVLEIARQQDRSSLRACGVTLAVVAGFRLLGFDVIVDNPLWTHQDVGSTPVLNALLLVYGLPATLTLVLARFAEPAERRGLSVVVYAIGFILVSMIVRQVFHGAYLDIGLTTSAEVYTYSASWLAFGVALLLGGAALNDPVMRSASLVVMILTVGKVFLYDASALTGLWRVVSLAGLGVSLLGLSWFYSRFVFDRKTAKK